MERHGWGLGMGMEGMWKKMAARMYVYKENADVGASEIFAPGGDDLYDYIELEGSMGPESSELPYWPMKFWAAHRVTNNVYAFISFHA
uniref:Uncharacterized protein n=1 Tax=Oryza glumipatula TaxID=40148 RepID=A0A0D9Y8W9_9ORYZ